MLVAYVDKIWKFDRTVHDIFEFLGGDEGVTRIVGGAVRDALLGRRVADVDFATSMVPEQVIKTAESAGIRVVPTGLSHGTLTLVIQGKPFEITTLRRDIVTDGRHAQVAFSTDWHEDAARRDFTFNAIYLDARGRLFDPNNGERDLRDGVVRFIGEPTVRIREDYLRILRFFRFHAWYGSRQIDPEGLAAIRRELGGLGRLSAERLGHECLRLLAAPKPVETVRAMMTCGVLDTVLGGQSAFDDFRGLLGVENEFGLAPDPVLRLALLSSPVAGSIQKRLRLSNMDAARVQLVANAGDFTLPETQFEARAMIEKCGRETFRDLFLTVLARQDEDYDHDSLEKLFTVLERWRIPEFPVSGADAIEAGISQGPDVGQAVAAARAAWVESDFSADRETLLEIMRNTADADF